MAPCDNKQVELAQMGGTAKGAAPIGDEEWERVEPQEGQQCPAWVPRSPIARGVTGIVVLSCLCAAGAFVCGKSGANSSGKPALPTPAKLRTIEYLGNGYDIFKGNPQEGTRNDPGFRGAIFELSYDLGKTLDDDRWAVPDYVHSVPVHICQTDFQTQEVRGSKSLLKSLNANVDASYGKFGAAFSASSSYKSIVNSLETKHSVFMIASAKCLVYESAIDLFYPPPVTAHFLSGLQELPPTCSTTPARTSYSNFIMVFGTHVAWKLTFGGQWGESSEFSESKWNEMKQRNFDMSAGASYNAKVIRASGGANVTSGREEGHNFSEARTNANSFCKGGSYSENQEEWMQSVRDKPMPIVYALQPIHAMLEERYVGGDIAGLEEKRACLTQAIESYCETLKNEDELESCDVPPPDDKKRTLVSHILATPYHSKDYGFRSYYETRCSDREYITRMTWRQHIWHGMTDLVIECEKSSYSSSARVRPDSGLAEQHPRMIDPERVVSVRRLGGIGKEGATKRLPVGVKFGSWTRPLRCPNGINGFQVSTQGKYGIVNVRAYCLQGHGEDDAVKEARNHEKGTWQRIQRCPKDTPVLHGILVTRMLGHGLVEVELECSNSNLLP